MEQLTEITKIDVLLSDFQCRGCTRPGITAGRGSP